jgi:hypothetical protein
MKRMRRHEAEHRPSTKIHSSHSDIERQLMYMAQQYGVKSLYSDDPLWLMLTNVERELDRWLWGESNNETYGDDPTQAHAMSIKSLVNRKAATLTE